MRIAVFGWYGHANAGDERIKFCINHFLMSLGGIRSIDFFDLHEHAVKGKTGKFDHYDLVIVGGGGLILSQYNYHDFILGIKTKMLTAGISVETELKGNPKRFAASLLEKSISVLVRDKDSANKLSILDAGNKVKISGDLTFLEPYKTLSVRNDNLIGVNLLPKPKYFKYSTLAFPYFSFILRQFSRLGVGNILSVVDFKEIISKLKDKFLLSPIPLYCAPQISDLPIYQKNDVEFLKLYFSNVPSSFSDHLLDDCCIFLSMRLHGSIFSIQKGIPVVSFSYLPKNKNFMSEARLDEYVIDSTNLEGIHSCIDKVMKERESIRERMDFFKEKCLINTRRDITDILNLVK